MPVERPFEGDFLFVNHSASQMKASPNRRKVFSHVQSKYRNWKRQEEMRALRASIKAPLSDAQPSVKAKEPASIEVPVLDSIQPTTKAKPTRYAQGSEAAGSEAESRQQARTKIAIHSLINEEEEEESELPDLATLTHEMKTPPLQPQSIMTILDKGNSDPFGAYAIEITPSANGMLSFHRDFVIPTLYHTTKHNWMTSASAWRDWRDCIDGLGDGVDGLGDEGAGSGFIASCATEAAVVSRNPAIQRQAVYYRTKSMAVLRKRLTTAAGGKVVHRGQLYWHINLLLGADTLSGNRAGTGAHLTILRHYFEHDGDKLDVSLLLYVIYHDVHRSSMFLCRPIFDVDEWLPRRLQPVVDAAQPYLPDLSGVKDRFLDRSIVDNPGLRTLFIERRESLAVWLFQTGSSGDESARHSTSLMGWLLVRVYLHQGRLVNFFLEAKARHHVNANPPHPHPPSPHPHLIHPTLCQGYISLGTLLYMRSISFNATVCGVRLFDATSTILSNMRELLELSESMNPNSPEYKRYENPRLWALYVGASAEWSMGMKPEDTGCWFMTHFATKAVNLGVAAWDEVRTVLRGFLYTDFLHPDGEEWFSRMLSSTARKKTELDEPDVTS
ncbi:uncharacterized protein Z519_11037 [Cladophialophora bantiana CBS 173.52]|uniref:Transcription factor domain-containing protein n=1 Tax=Cladophialophora bantiana (strain ATCC 10958 / CBS 173.52 / CDC B-1940 / NIH 8579) TaxID=1442370 RepID=A0A0D2H592_CLAB1|nr:uncharacterized protein Z519_11037 [Cladophialophora bantiana CBS 173.52]KIW88468.1 hypothetical protein Z519_11037 [Cladophialophora bantiana CBS 173.52]